MRRAHTISYSTWQRKMNWIKVHHRQFYSLRSSSPQHIYEEQEAGRSHKLESGLRSLPSYLSHSQQHGRFLPGLPEGPHLQKDSPPSSCISCVQPCAGSLRIAWKRRMLNSAVCNRISCNRVNLKICQQHACNLLPKPLVSPVKRVCLYVSWCIFASVFKHKLVAGLGSCPTVSLLQTQLLCVPARSKHHSKHKVG